MDKIEIIKNSVKIDDVIALYGFQKDRKGYIKCPFHAEKSGSCHISNNLFRCWGCGASGDLIRFVELMEQCDFMQAVDFIGEKFRLDFGRKWSAVEIAEFEKRKAEREKQQKLEAEHKQKVIERNWKLLPHKIIGWHEDVLKTDYWFSRGFTMETIERFFLGYDEKYKCVTIPYSRKLNYYQSRSVEGEKRFYKPRSDLYGNEPLYNAEALKSDKCVFVTEAPIDSISIMQCGGISVALCGVANAEKLVKYIVANKLAPKLLLALDNDKVGKETTDKLSKCLTERNIDFKIVDIYADCKDANELLIKNAEQLQQNIREVLKV